jgi:hypothetical protein
LKLPNFNTINFKDTEISRFQDAVSGSLSPVLSSPLAKVSLITGVVLAAGDNIVNHLFGATPQFWFVVDKDAAADIFRKTSLTPDLTLLLNSSAAVTVSLIVG